ncbi:TraB/GumN family protein [Dyella dinghuensis]|uniref:TraB/GumN family protein n=2 Tax=Dyella dinghuensis TaxID=1920169 RepID=A0A3S0RUE9_9GAMM|nr:TraB/GumN family protein [Dyella dinghuensis]
MCAQICDKPIAKRKNVMMEFGIRRLLGNHGVFCRLLVIGLLVYVRSIAHAQSAPQPATSANAVPTLAPVVVTGELPGPALWKVSKGDHVMWILGLVTPVPRDMRWKFTPLEKRIAASQAVLKPPGLEIGVLGPSANRVLTSSMMRLKYNPDGERLEQVLEPALYKRWRMQKNRYLYDNQSIDDMRPIFAGRRLYDAVLRHAGLVEQTRIEKTVYDAADRHGVKIIDPAYQLALGDPHAAIGTLGKYDMDDQRCLGMVLNAIEHDLVQTTLRANAWATGDLDGLKATLMETQEDACLPGIDTSPFAKALGLSDMQQHIDQSWIEHAEQALAQNTQTVALLPMEQLFMPNGYLSALRADGYTVQAPPE